MPQLLINGTQMWTVQVGSVCADTVKSLTECENGKNHEVSVVSQQICSVRCDDKSDYIL